MLIPENKSRHLSTLAAFLFAVFLITGTAACSSVHSEAKYPSANRDEIGSQNDIYAKPDSVFGKGGLHLFGKGDKDDSAGATGIGVNSFLWRASLDTVAFMPLTSADPFGGTILTDWYAPPDTPGTRYKLNVFILDKHMRSDAVQVKVFKQTQTHGAWHDAATDTAMGRKIEDAILTRARQMRVAQAGE